MLSHFTGYDISNHPFKLVTHISKYHLRDDSGREIPSLCIHVSEMEHPNTYYGTLSFAFFDFLPIKNAFYAGLRDFIDCEGLLASFATPTGAYRADSNGALHQLYILTDDSIQKLLDDNGEDGEKYRAYSKAFDEYSKSINPCQELAEYNPACII